MVLFETILKLFQRFKLKNSKKKKKTAFIIEYFVPPFQKMKNI